MNSSMIIEAVGYIGSALVLVSFLNVSPIYIIVCVLVLGFSVTYYRTKK